jgi:hypothetical protein
MYFPDKERPGRTRSSSSELSDDYCVAIANGNVEVKASHSATPLRMEAETVPGPAYAAQAEAAERMYLLSQENSNSGSHREKPR